MKTIRLVPVLVAFAILAVSVAVSANPQQNQPPPNTAAVQVASPPSQVGARYQYRCETKWEARMYDPETLKRLNDLGAQGWRLLPPALARVPGMAYADVFCFEKAY